MVEHFSLEKTVEFTGQVKIDDYLPHIDLVVVTSISEAQPLVILEAGASGIPTVATNVGACPELIEGRSDEDPKLGMGGAVVPLSNPSATADAVYRLLTDREHYKACAEAMRQRVATYYTKQLQHQAYNDVYNTWTQAEPAAKRAS